MTLATHMPKKLAEGILVPLSTAHLRESFDQNLIIRLKQFDVPLAVQGQARWVMTRCRQCANLYLSEDGSVTTSYTDPVDGELDIQLFKFGLYALRPIEQGEPLRWHVGPHDIQCELHLDVEARAEIAEDPDLRVRHHDCYTDFVAEHHLAPGVQLLRPLIHATLVDSAACVSTLASDAGNEERIIMVGKQKYLLDEAAVKARTRCRDCANTVIWLKAVHQYPNSIQLELVTTRIVNKGEAIRWWISDGCWDVDLCIAHRHDAEVKAD